MTAGFPPILAQKHYAQPFRIYAGKSKGVTAS